MARKKIREYDAKRIFVRNLSDALRGKLNMQLCQIVAPVNWDALVAANPWLATARLVCKPDVLFGQRGKAGLILLNASLDELKQWVTANLGADVRTHGGATGKLTHLLVEPFIAHDQAREAYLCIEALRSSIRISFSPAGGVHVEEEWAASGGPRVTTVQESAIIDAKDLATSRVDWPPAFFAGVADPAAAAEFAQAAVDVFRAADFSMMEFNPLAVLDGRVVPLDMRGVLDDCAAFANVTRWGAALEFPPAFGKAPRESERYIEELDAKTGASLKLTILNPTGRVWTLVAGGGASVIYADTVADLGFGTTLGNYGEYSGNPSEEHTYEYAKTVLSAATWGWDAPADAAVKRGRCVIIGGAIANFTDVAVTFKGIIRALMDCQERLRAVNVSLWVRRAGPNFEKALAMMRAAGPALQIPVVVKGPEVAMTSIVHEAAQWLREFDARGGPPPGESA